MVGSAVSVEEGVRVPLAVTVLLLVGVADMLLVVEEVLERDAVTLAVPVLLAEAPKVKEDVGEAEREADRVLVLLPVAD
jgi:hypothetical protein